MSSTTATDAPAGTPTRSGAADPSPALAARYYTDPEVAGIEQRHIFARTWQLAGHESDLPVPGARLVATVAGREVLVVRTEDGGLAAHLNVCRHRGSRLVTAALPDPTKAPATSAHAIRCPYHGWTYRLDGALVGAPEGRAIPCLDRPSLGLYPARVESFLGFVFVNLDTGATPLQEQLADLPEPLRRYLGPELRPVGRHRIHADAEVQRANWKVVVDNYLEGYHVPVAHPGLMRLLDYQRYTVSTGANFAYYEVPLRDKPSSNLRERAYQWLATPMPGLDPSDRRIWRYLALYPNTLIDFYPDHVLAWKIVPHEVDTASLPGAFYARPGAGPRTRLAQRLNIKIGWITNDEDAELVARVQRGVSTPGWAPGPLSRRELGVGWFADRVRADVDPHLTTAGDTTAGHTTADAPATGDGERDGPA